MRRPTVLIRVIGSLTTLSLAFSAAANDFAFTPDTSSLNFMTYKWSVSIDGALASGNPPLTVLTGQTYTFSVVASFTHPFWIDQAPGLGGSVVANPYPAGDALSANGATSTTAITMNLPADAPDTLYYACGNHSSMTGSITVVHDLVFRGSFD